MARRASTGHRRMAKPTATTRTRQLVLVRRFEPLSSALSGTVSFFTVTRRVAEDHEQQSEKQRPPESAFRFHFSLEGLFGGRNAVLHLWGWVGAHAAVAVSWSPSV